MTRPIFPNITDARDDAQRVFEASQNPGRWDRRVPPHGLDLKCGHCTAGHRLPGRSSWQVVGGWPDWHFEATCECGTVLAGDLFKEWADHVREVTG